MARRIECPFIDGGWIELPDEWLGVHCVRRDEATEKANEAGMRSTQTQFTVSMALLENWGGLPGLDGNPGKWDFATIPYRLIAWITKKVMVDFTACFLSGAALSNPSQTPTATPPTEQATG